MTTVTGEPLRLPPQSRPRTVVDLIHRAVERRADHEAIRWKGSAGWSSWTYAEMWSQVSAVSLGMRGLGIGAGDRVAIVSRSRPEFLVTDLATLALGAVSCPIYHGEPPARMADMVQRVGARLVFVEDGKLLARLRSGGEGDLEIPVVGFDTPPPDGRAGDPGAMPLSELRRVGDQSADAIAEWGSSWAGLDPEQVASIVHTMGADGEPKGVILPHRSLLHLCLAAVQAVPLSETDRTLSVLPMSHVMERVCGVLTVLGAGGTVAFAERAMERWVPNMVEVQPTVVTAVPVFFERIGQRIQADVAGLPRWQRRAFAWAAALGRQRYRNHLAGRSDGPWLSVRRWVADRLVLSRLRRRFGGRLRFFVSGGAALPEATGIFFESLGFTILEGYGLTEAAPLLTVNHLDSYRYGTVGPAVAETTLRLDPATGEILARGPQVMLGYLDRPADTARVLEADGWLRTGDVGEFDDAGLLRITGRTKNLLVLATGKNVAPAPIENALATSPYIREAVLLGDGQEATGALLVPDLAALQRQLGADDRAGAGVVGDGESPAAFLRRSDVTDLIRSEVERLTAGFATFERPRRFVLLAEFPVEGGAAPRGPKARSALIDRFPEAVRTLFNRSGPDQ